MRGLNAAAAAAAGLFLVFLFHQQTFQNEADCPSLHLPLQLSASDQGCLTVSTYQGLRLHQAVTDYTYFTPSENITASPRPIAGQSRAYALRLGILK